MIKKEYKFRYNTILQKNGLEGVFIEINSKMFPRKVVLQDVVQYIKINMTNDSYYNNIKNVKNIL